jgi:hypothetical protein
MPAVTAIAEEEVQGLCAVARDEHLVCEVAVLQRSQRQVDVVGVVFD